MSTKRNIKFVERRSNHRLPMNIGASLKLANDVVVSGKTKNLSFGGTFVEFDYVPVVVLEDYLRLELFGRVRFTVKVIHLDENGIGFQFDFILIKYYEHFKQMMLNHAPDPDRLIKELGRQVELK